ncbi:MAG: molybdopterin-dependent oxidoreductase [Candidatus Bathyarchaeota archaeon]|nr:molybdopterin-dependent oxidoreductase [Candidatus Bathyarchaeota archaeon]
MRQKLMKRRFFRRTLLLITFGLIWFSFLRGVLSPEFSSAPKNIMTGDSERSLLVDGLVSRPLNLAFSELVAMPRSTVDAELWCVTPGGFPPPFLVASGNWTGVRLGLILEKAEASQQAVTVEFYAKDGYTTNISVTAAMRKDVILAYEKDGEPLPETLRLVFPEAPGYLWISMITHIKLVKPDFKGLEIENNGPIFAHEGDTIKYVIEVRNLDIYSPLASVMVKDEMVGFSWRGDLAARESKVFNVNYVIPVGAEDPLNNKVTVSAELNDSTIYAEDTWTVDVLHPKLEVSRTVKPSEAYAGDNVTHTIVITNIGDAALFNLTLVDSVYGYAPIDLVPSSLGPRDSFVWSFNASVHEAIDNVATSTGADALGTKVSDFDKSFLEVKSNKTGISEITDWLFSIYVPHVIAAVAATALAVYSILFLKRRKNRGAHIVNQRNNIRCRT